MATAQLLSMVGVLPVACENGKSKPSGAATQTSNRVPTKPPPVIPREIASAIALAPVKAVAQASREVNEPSELDAGPARKRQNMLKLGKRQVILDELVDVAPAGPSAATPGGVLLLLRDGRPVFAPLALKKSVLRAPQPTPIEPLQLEGRELVALEHGPVVAGGFAYFVHGGHLVRRALPDGPVENLADDARSYTRVAVPDLPHADRPFVVGYIARHPTEKETLLAKLWIEGQGTVVVTPDGSTGNTVALARTREGYLAVSLESRTGMSPVHARRADFDRGRVRLGPDVVPWVAGTAQPLTEIYALSDLDEVFGFLPIERDATHFGLARIELGAFPKLGASVHWREYPNGLEPAAMATGHLCGTPVALYARPATAEPKATQELHLSPLGDDGLAASTVVAASRSFADASFAGLDDGALVVYVADRRTWARRLRCVP